MMYTSKFALAIIFFLIINQTSYSQNKAIDENGRQVLLFSNGTWKYDNDSIAANNLNNDTVAINTKTFSKPASANFIIKSNIVNVGVNFNTKTWVVKPHLDNETTPEYRFTLKSNDAFALLITERTPIDLNDMRDIALINAQKAAADAKIVRSEFRNVNGLKMLCLEITGTTKGIKFIYFGYYYSNEQGTVQLVAFTSQQLFKSLYNSMEELLNGLVELNAIH